MSSHSRAPGAPHAEATLTVPVVPADVNGKLVSASIGDVEILGTDELGATEIAYIHFGANGGAIDTGVSLSESSVLFLNPKKNSA